MKNNELKPFNPAGNASGDPSERTNGQRADEAARTVNAYLGISNLDNENDRDDAICDLIADIMHFCHREGIDFEDRVQMATTHFRCETNGEEM